MSTYKYRAELYDEVWKLAKDAGFENVTMVFDQMAALREELATHKYKSELYDEVWPKATGMGFMNITMALAEIPRLQQRLTAAEQRNAEMTSILVDVLEWFDDGVGRSDAEFAFLRDIASYLASHAKPTESGASE